MSLVINHNTSALNTHRILSVTGGSMANSIEKLASGFKINKGADDPSGLTISEQLRSQISGLDRAVRNTSEANNLLDIAGGALNEMNSILKKMRGLALHAANDGITSPDQIAADQVELDSGLETIERIAATTRYSNQNILNGNKQIVFDVVTDVNEPTDHQLLDTGKTRIDQVFKRDSKIAISHTGSIDEHQANVDASAQRAYLEADNSYALCEIDGAFVNSRQEFTLTGSLGSRMFSYDKNTHLGVIARDINNIRHSTGVGATLTFASDMRAVRTSGGIDGDGPDYENNIPADPVTGLANGTYVYRPDDAQIYGAGLNNPETAAVSSYCITPDAANAFRVGYNCDGDGKIYAKVVDKATNSIEYYKDEECTMLVGKGGTDFFSPANNSGIPGSPTKGLDGIFLTLTDKARNQDVYSIAIVGQPITEPEDVDVSGLSGWCDPDAFTMSGVDLGTNTSAAGDLYFRYVPATFESDGSVREFRVEAFKDSNMRPSDLVATSGQIPANVQSSGLTAGGGQTVRLESVIMADGADSGLNFTINMPMPPYGAATSNRDMPTGESVGMISFTNLGLRLYSLEYGSAESIRLENHEGQLFYQYRERDTLERVMLKEEKTSVVYGQDAKIAVNGTGVITTGLKANVTTQDFSGELVFNAGRLGKTTLAVAGYENGKIYSRATTLQGIAENEDVITAASHKGLRPDPLTTSLALVNSGGNGFRDASGNPVTLTFDLSAMPDGFFDRFPEGVDGGIRAQWYNQSLPMLCIQVQIPVGGTGLHLDYQFDAAALAQGIRFPDNHPSYPGLYIKTDAVIDIGKSTYDYDLSTNGKMPWAPLKMTTPTGADPLLEVATNATHPRGNTSETISDFQGGMRLQLGGTENDHDRTIYSVQLMLPVNLGRTTHNGVNYSLLDLMGGGPASLSKNPNLAVKIIAQAIDDVSSLRARMGAFQANMLQTNVNNLETTTENLIKSESNIRDTDMAEESTEFTRSQIMSQAGTSMLAQANQVSQNVLSLLR